MAIQGEGDDARVYRVVVNQEEQYSIWPVEKQSPFGWIDTGISGTKQDCIRFIQEVWADMTPSSLRQKTEMIN